MRLIPRTKSRFNLPLPMRLNLLKDTVSSLILRDQIVTTKTRALAIRPIIEMLIKNAKENTPTLRQEAENWTVDHKKSLSLLYGPLRSRYADRPAGFTRVYNLLHTQFRHNPLAVIELVDGPKDTLRSLEKYKDELAAFKEKNGDLLNRSPEELVQTVRTSPRGRLDLYYRLKQKNDQNREIIKLKAGREKSRWVMEQFAKQAVGGKAEPMKEFYVK